MSAAPRAAAPPRAVVLLSGGLDSATVLAIARDEGFAVTALSFRYGQRHAVELDAAARVAAALGVAEHLVIDIDLRVFGGSALTADIAVPKSAAEPGAATAAGPADVAAGGAGATPGGAGGASGGVSGGSAIPITYVPARNTIFLSYALALAEVRGARDIFIGVNAVDYSGYPDCRPEYVAAFEQMANLATRAGVEGRGVAIRAPLIAWSKEEIIRRGLALGVDYGLTRSCYDPAESGAACGRCEACGLRRAAFERLGRRDPAP